MSESPARVSAVNVGEHPNRGWVVSTFGKRTYLVRNGVCVESPEQQPLQEVPVAAEDGVDLVAEADLVMHRDLVDILVRGHAYPHATARSFEAGLAIDQFLAKFAVFGNRRVETVGARLHFTPPEDFDRIPLGWQSAYGGFDAVTYHKHGANLDELMKKAGIVPDPRFGLFSYPRNPLGKGYLCEVSSEAVAACTLPNLEALDALLTPERLDYGPKRWPAAPSPVSTTWLPYTFFPRSFWLGLPLLPFDDKQIRPEDFQEVRSGLIGKDSARADGGPPERRFSPLVSQAAPIGLRCRAVETAAKIRVKNLHPKFSQWDFKLPGDTPRMYVRWPGQQSTEVRPQIRTVLIEPDQDRITLVWVADLVLASPFPLAHAGAIEHAVRWRSG
jgi:hypothetical protein